jgi:hypothetical protein
MFEETDGLKFEIDVKLLYSFECIRLRYTLKRLRCIWFNPCIDLHSFRYCVPKLPMYRYTRVVCRIVFAHFASIVNFLLNHLYACAFELAATTEILKLNIAM